MTESNIAGAKPRNKINTKMMILCGIFAALSAVGAFIRIPMPIIPFTLQVPIILLAAALLGSKGAMLSQTAYILIGLVGFPIFTKGGGIGYVFEPTFGFLIGFILMAYCTGKYLEITKKYTVVNVFIACAIGIVVDYICGVAYMYLILNLYLKTATPFLNVLWSGALVFLPKDLILALCVSLLSVKLRKALKFAM